MILIITHHLDVTTDKVIEWLKYYGYNDIIRLNTPERFIIKRIKLLPNSDTEFIINIDGTDLSVDDISFVWYRNNPLSFNSNFSEFPNTDGINLKNFYNFEWYKSRDLILSELCKKPMLGNFFDNFTNKLNNLQVASKCGFLIPETIISEYGVEFTKFSANKTSITKPINEIYEFSDDELYIDMHTVQFPKEDKLPDLLDVPCLLQRKIEKWIEVRVFILYDKVYTMAIFSQIDNTSTRPC